jgi:hypothetical protein
VDVRDERRALKNAPEQVSEGERLDGSLRAIDADNDRTCVGRVVHRHL